MENPVIRSGSPSGDGLVHMLYDAVLDNSLWPEMMSELLEYIEHARQNPDVRESDVRGIAEHFERAMKISEATVSLQEQTATLSGILDGLAIGVALYNDRGELHYRNSLASGAAPEKLLTAGRSLTAPSPLDRALVTAGDADSAREGIAMPGGSSSTAMAVPVQAMAGMTLPPDIAWLVVNMPPVDASAIGHIGRNFYLTTAETALLNALYNTGSLRTAAGELNLTYETSRTYLKRVLAKTGAPDQRALLQLVSRNPVSMVRNLRGEEERQDQNRRLLHLPDGRQLEYFSIGPEGGEIVLHFDALTGVAIDALGTPEIYQPVLQELGMRIITPCRPGTFRSTFNRMGGLSEFTPDLICLVDHLGASRVSVLSQAFGASSALAFAAGAGDLVSSVVLCAPNFPRHEPEDWRNMDVFYLISGVIGKRAPGLMKTIIPFLMRSVMQNAGKYLQRHIKRSRCQYDVEVLSSPQLHGRIPKNLRERVASGNDGLVQENFLNTHGWDFDLSAISCPVAVIQGGLDNVSDPVGSQRLASLIPGARYHVMPEYGQYLMFTEWPWLLELCKCGARATDLTSNYFHHQLSPNGDIF